MPTINLSRVILNQAFSQIFTITRTTGRWNPDNGKFDLDAPEVFHVEGTIIPNKKKLNQVLEGDMVAGSVEIHTVVKLYLTQEGTPSKPENYLSDKITWNCELYKILEVRPLNDFGFYQATGARIQGS